MKDEIVPLRLKTNMMSNKIDECKALLINTNSSIQTYLNEAKKVAKKYKGLKKIGDEHKSIYKKLSDAALKVFQENSHLQKLYEEETSSHEVIKNDCQKLLLEIKKIQA